MRVQDCDHNKQISIKVYVHAVKGSTNGRRAYRLEVETEHTERLQLVIWEQSPAANLSWKSEEWYQIEDALVKQWANTTELNATKNTTAQPFGSLEQQSQRRCNEQPDSTGNNINKCGFTWHRDCNDESARSGSCCYRDTWRGFDRCIWHAETPVEKPVEELEAQRVSSDLRQLNGRPRELLCGAHLPEADLSDMLLTAVDLSGANLRSATLTDSYLHGANFSQATLTQATLKDSTLSWADFSDAELNQADLTNTTLVGTDFTDANLRGVDFSKATISKTEFTGVAPADLDLSEAKADDDFTLNEDSTPAASPTFLHIGPSHYASSNVTTWRRQEFHDVLEEAIQIAIRHDVDAIILTGQLFATRTPPNKTVGKLRSLLQRVDNNDIHFLHAASERDLDMEIVDALADDGLVIPLGPSPFIVEDAAVYGLPPAEGSDYRSVLRELQASSQDTRFSILCIPAMVNPPATESHVSLDTIIDEAPLDFHSILAGHTDNFKPRSLQPESKPSVYLIGPTEFMLRKYALETPPVYPCQVGLYSPQSFYEYYELDNRPVEIYTIQCGPETTLTDIQTEIDPVEKNILISLQGQRGGESVSVEEIERWLNSHTEVYKVWDDRDSSSKSYTTQQGGSEITNLVLSYESEGSDNETAVSNQRTVETSSPPTAGSKSNQQDIEPNRVSELYEAFRSMYTTLDLLMEHRITQIDPEDMTAIPVQYKTILETLVWKDEYLPSEVDGFGTQQHERVTGQMSEYREAYGDDDWVTDYQVIDVVPFSETVQTVLESHNLVDDASVFVRPLSPGAGVPLPEIAETETELGRALHLLSQFKTEPAVPGDNGSVFRFPAEAVYQRICEMEDVEGIDPDNVELHPLNDTIDDKDGYTIWSKGSPPALYVDEDLDLEEAASKLASHLDTTPEQLQQDMGELMQSEAELEEVIVTMNAMYTNQSSDSALWDINGVGLKRGHLLYHAGFTEPSDIADASVKELSDIRGISGSAARCVREVARNICERSPTMAEELARSSNIPRQEVAAEYEKLVPRLVPPKEAIETLRVELEGPPPNSVHSLNELNLSEIHFLSEQGFTSIAELAAASVSEIEEAKYMSQSRAETIREAAQNAATPEDEYPPPGIESEPTETTAFEERSSTTGTRKSSGDGLGEIHSGDVLSLPKWVEDNSLPEVEIRLPEMMLNRDQWLLWKAEDGRKIPRAPWQTDGELQYVDATNPENWVPFEQAKEWAEKLPQRCELAFSLTPDDSIVFLDIDDVVGDGGITAPAQSLVNAADSYTALSTSGSGLHVFLKGTLPSDIKSIRGELEDEGDGSIEVYDRNRFVAITGFHISNTQAEITPTDGFIENLRSDYAEVSAQTPDSALSEPVLSRDEIQETETTSNIQDIFDAISHTRPSDIRLRSKRTNKRGDGTRSYDPSWVKSESGTRLGELDDIWIYRDGMIALNALQVVALEEGIISDEQDYPEGTQFWDAVEALRERGAAIPHYEPETSPIERTKKASAGSASPDESEVAQIINHGNPVRPYLDKGERDYQEQLALRLTPIIIDSVDKLELPSSVAPRTAEVYTQAHAAGVVYGKSHECSIGAGLRVAAIEVDEPRPFEEIAQVLDEDADGIRRKLRQILTQTELSDEIDASDLIIHPEEYVRYAARKLNRESDEELLGMVEQTLSECNNTSGANPLAVVAGAFYAVMKQSDRHQINQEEIATALGFATVTIRNHYKKFI